MLVLMCAEEALCVLLGKPGFAVPRVAVGEIQPLASGAVRGAARARPFQETHMQDGSLAFSPLPSHG